MEVNKKKNIKNEDDRQTTDVSIQQEPPKEKAQKGSDEIKKFVSSLSIQTKIIIGLMTIIVILVVIIMMNGKGDDRISITTESSLQKIIEINELSTIYYTYNAVATKYKENKEETKENVKYYVAYEGIVKAGIDFSAIEINVDEKQKKVFITLPEVEIHEAEVNIGSLDYIFVSNVDEKDRVSQEAYQLCKEDLNARIQTEEYLKTSARENAISAVEALLEPWIATIDKKYDVEVD